MDYNLENQPEKSQNANMILKLNLQNSVISQMKKYILMVGSQRTIESKLLSDFIGKNEINNIVTLNKHYYFKLQGYKRLGLGSSQRELAVDCRDSKDDDGILLQKQQEQKVSHLIQQWQELEADNEEVYLNFFMEQSQIIEILTYGIQLFNFIGIQVISYCQFILLMKYKFLLLEAHMLFNYLKHYQNYLQLHARFQQRCGINITQKLPTILNNQELLNIARYMISNC
ncbi:unnamed protein product (macronuclear) [Paramecium tetraurelia]|uniref:Uncharacterized protein n=1 Tax=Paramecium tetraurelia TaxID=5888 RepID=A0BEY1_PARTE|nr:uncharacterized protein GSPATT00028133001 [Paramecium tetraurelia]CAK57098.1 unnamed protein product [Paramecium tetraurelia]|eukprot:XP_001424496.1 hypothetical protein (macronuclear) [Paramecium tetraurelia strain d4-2]